MLMITTSIKRVDATANLLQVLLVTTIAMLAGCGQSPERIIPHEMLNATLWQQTSAEYIGVTTQTYQLARINLDHALADTSWTAALEQTGDYSGLPPA
ncbi:MAG: hypothetical protein OEV12_09325, partial [Gammaproteobacteria bacterium]|nr:hypothetical protein [Gammaproteobacteria bacterium]